jgi:hypothetical protein
MLSLNVPKNVIIEILDTEIIIKGPLGEKRKKKGKDILLAFDNVKGKL